MLLDVQFHVTGGRRKSVAHRHARQQPVRRGACGSERDAVRIAQRVDLRHRIQARERAAAETAQRKTAALFSGPRYRLDRMFGDDSGRVEFFERAQRGDRAVRTVVRAARRNGVEVRAAQQRRAVAPAGAAREHVAGAVLLHRMVRRARPLHEQTARGRVGGGEQAPVDAVFGRADGRKLGQPFSEADD